MNAKKCKALRKVCKESFPDMPVTISVNPKLGEMGKGIVSPMFYPEGSYRRVYQDGKKVLS